MSNKVTPLTPEQINFATRCFEQYCNKLEDVGRGRPSAADASHSAMLYRLLTGKPLLEKAPPKRYSYPDYRLGEGEPVEVSEVWDANYAPKSGMITPHETDGTEPVDDAFGVVIDQSREWLWINEAEGLLLHKNGDNYRLTRHPDGKEGGVLQKVTE